MRANDVANATHQMRVRWLAAAGAIFGLTGVAAGAFGAHAAKAWMAAERMSVFETATRYQVLHALALFASAWVLQSWPGRLAWVAGLCFIAGTVLFCGSLYLLALLDLPRLGAITPFGGLGFLAGWTLLVVALLRS